MDALHGNAVARLDDRVLRLGVERWIHLLEEGIRCLIWLDVRPVVDELANRNPSCEVLHRTEVIAMVVRRHEMVDLLEACVRRGGHDTVTVAGGGGSAVPRVDE